MEKQNLVGGLPKFGTEKVMLKVCEACQLRKQVKHPFLAQTTHVSSKPLEMIHSDVWTIKTMCRNPSLGLATKAKGITRVRAKRKPGSHITYSWECKKV